MHTNSLDEVLAIPTEEAATIALRTQQIIAEESGVTHSIDPLGGSYFVEALTNEMETQAMEYIRRIDEMGGMIEALERHYPQMEIADAAYKFQQQIDRREKIMVGVNKYETEEAPPVEILKIDPELESRQIARTQEIKNNRNNKKAEGEVC